MASDGKIQQTLLRRLPGIDRVLEAAKTDARFARIPKSVLLDGARKAVDDLRSAILEGAHLVPEGDLTDAALLDRINGLVRAAMTLNLRPVINATGVIVHTNLGRSCLARSVAENVVAAATRYTNLEYDLALGRRGSRYAAVEDLLCEISGAAAAMVVNNNAGAVLLCLDTLARGMEVVVSRGELVEIGGSFRIPDVMAKSGCTLREVGTTNRTHLADYERAIGSETGLLLKVHTSNFSVVGFTSAVPVGELVSLGAKHRLPVMEDLGSGTFVDFSTYGLTREPTVQESVAAGVDLVTFSGDKLLGGPQAGIIAGKKDVVAQIRQNPLTRALRIDKMTLAALESTVRLYRDEREAVAVIPTLRDMTRAVDDIARHADRLAEALKAAGGGKVRVQAMDCSSRAGGGSLPLLDLPSRCLAVHVEGMSASAVERHMRASDPPVVGRIEDDAFVMDVRCVREEETALIADAFRCLIQGADR